MAVEDAAGEIPDEDADGEESSEGGSKLGGKKKLILFIALPLVLLLGGGAGAYFFGLLDPLIGDPPTEEALIEEAEQESARDAVFYDLPEMLVNLNSPGRKNNYLKLSISLELDDSSNIDVIESVMPRIVDNFQVYLRELRVEDLRGSAGLTRLREELLMRINIAARPAKVSDVLFREMLIQ